MLRLTGQFEIKDFVPCPVCDGKGTVPQGPTLCVRMGINGSNWRGPIYVPGEGCPRPCPECDGKKVVPPGSQAAALGRHVYTDEAEEDHEPSDGMY
ncbi:MAG: hypothetical protein KGS45_08995 [Planctomycetes bacterium]|nr:hypothetical protein [Planctomycetota bacterium]